MPEKKKGVVPRLRFPEFRDAGPWEVKRLGDIGTIRKGKGISKSDIKPNGSLPCIRYGELYTFYSEVIREIASFTDVPPTDLVLSEENDVIIPASGETKEDIATASCLEIKGVALGGDLNIFRSPMNGAFLAYYIRGNLKSELSKVAQGDSVVHLYPVQLEKLKLAVPPDQEEQQKIADCLSSLDEVIELEAKRLEALEAHKKGLMQQLFPREGETTPRLRFPEFRDAGPWEVKRLGEVLTFQTGFPFSSKYFNETGDGLRLIRNADLKSSDRMVFYSGPYEQKFIVNNGDILVGMDGDFSPSIWRNGKALLNQRVGRVFAQEGNSLTFLNYSLSVALKVIEQRTAQTTVKHLSHATVERTKCSIPVFCEQQKIADCLSSLDEVIELEAKRLDALKAHKKGLMQQLFPQEVG